MAISGSTNFSVSRDDIIKYAYLLCGAVAIGEAPTGNEASQASLALNAMIKAWSKTGTQLWKNEELVLFLTKGTPKYSLGASADRAAFAADMIPTLLDGALTAAATAVTVDSTTGMAVSDVILLCQDDDTIHADTIATIPTATTLTLTTGITSAAADNKNVFTYTTAITTRPLKVSDGRFRTYADPTDPIDIPFTAPLSRDQYFDLPQKESEGPSTQFYYDPQLATTEMYLFPAPDRIEATANLTVKMPVDDFDATTDTPDFPQEWYEALAHGLAWRIAPTVGMPLNERIFLKGVADEMKNDVGLFDNEPASIIFQPDFADQEEG